MHLCCVKLYSLIKFASLVNNINKLVTKTLARSQKLHSINRHERPTYSI